MRVLAIDPGPEMSAWCIYDAYDGRPVVWATDENYIVLSMLEEAGVHGRGNDFASCEVCVIEMIASYGMPVGKEVFETVLWIGRYDQEWMRGICSGGERAELVYRMDVKTHLCHSAKATDSNIRQALIDRFGPGKEKAIGLKNSPGPLYKMDEHCRSALAVALLYADTWLDMAAAA